MARQEQGPHAQELARHLGALAVDERTGRTGLLMDVMGYNPGQGQPCRVTAFLRPAGGGKEWTAPPDRVHLVEPDEAASG
jgi:hypothetical protein